MKVMIIDKDGIRCLKKVRASQGYTWIPFANNGNYYWREMRIRSYPVIPDEVKVVVK